MFGGVPTLSCPGAFFLWPPQKVRFGIIITHSCQAQVKVRKVNAHCLVVAIQINLLGGVGVQGQVKGSGKWLRTWLVNIFGWEHAKVKSMKINPPVQGTRL